MKKVILSIAVMAAVTVMTGVGHVSAANEMLAIGIVLEDDGYANIKFEELNEKVQNAVRVLIDKYDINSLQYNADKKITKVTATNKEDQSVKTVYFDDEGKEVNPDAAPRNTEAPELL